MDFLVEWYHFFRDLINPELLARGGLITLVLVIFAETGLMVGFFLPGDSLLFTAGLLCSSGHLEVSFPILLICLIISAIIGDQTGYYIGRQMGEKLFTRDESWFFKPKYVQKTKEFYDRHGGKAIVLGRFVPIVRTFAPMIAGVAKLEYKTFVFYNVTGGIIWITSMLTSGYLLVQWVPEIKNYIHFVILLIIIISIIPIITTYISERKLALENSKLKKETQKDNSI